MVAIKEVLNGKSFTKVDKPELADAVSQWQPTPEPEPDTINFDTDQLIAIAAATANAFSTQ